MSGHESLSELPDSSRCSTNLLVEVARCLGSAAALHEIAQAPSSGARREWVVLLGRLRLLSRLG
eukprot:9772-Heterococcus_DN1.PRE.2